MTPQANRAKRLLIRNATLLGIAVVATCLSGGCTGKEPASDKPASEKPASDKVADGGDTRSAVPIQVPQWNKKGKLPDGRVFVTDGAIAIDALIAHVDVLPTDSLSDVHADWLQSILTTPQPTEFGCEDLEFDANRQVWKGPNVQLNPTYVTYLRATYPGERLRFRSNKAKDPVLILVHGAVIGVLMPMDRDA